VAGSMHIVSHGTSISEPTVMALVEPGEIIGLAQIENGVSVDPNCWICACGQCDVFILSKDYLRYMWDQML
jgi:ferredoxin